MTRWLRLIMCAFALLFIVGVQAQAVTPSVSALASDTAGRMNVTRVGWANIAQNLILIGFVTSGLLWAFTGNGATLFTGCCVGMIVIHGSPFLGTMLRSAWT